MRKGKNASHFAKAKLELADDCSGWSAHAKLKGKKRIEFSYRESTKREEKRIGHATHTKGRKG